MKNKALFVALLLCFFNLKAQEYYLKTVDVENTGSDNGLDILADEGGYVILCGSAGGTGFFKVNTDGYEIWQNNFNFAPYEPGVTGIIQLPNGNYLLSGGVVESGMLYQDLFTFVTTNGGIYRHVIHGDTMDNRAPDSILRDNYIISYTSITPPGIELEQYNHTLLLTMDTAGTILRRDTLQNIAGYPRNGSEAIILLPTNEYILGIGAQNQPNEIYGYLRKTDTIGTTLWEKKINDVGTMTVPLHLAVQQNGNFVVSWIDFLGGVTQNRGSYFVRCYNAAGDSLWQYTFLSVDYGRNIQDLYVCSNGDVIGCGYTGNFDITGSPTSWIFRLSPSGELLWLREYVYWASSGQTMQLYGITEDHAGDIVATGFAILPNDAGLWTPQAVLLKVDDMGCFGADGCNDTTIVYSVVTGVDPPPSVASGGHPPVRVLPSSSPGEVFVLYDLPSAFGAAHLSFYDLNGRLVSSHSLPLGDTFVSLPLPSLPSGLYVYVVEQSGAALARGKVALGW